MNLRDFIKPLRVLKEGGNAEVDGHQAQQIDLKVHNRAYIVPILSALLDSINAGFQQSAGGPLWSPKVLKARKYLSGSSLHFFNTDIADDEFERVKPKVGDIDTQVNKASEPQLAQWLDSVKGQVVGNARFLGYGRGNEQYSSLWELTDPPIKVQIDFEFVDYSEKEEPTDWAAFSHSSSWDDISQGIKGVFHKFLIQSLSKISSQDFILRKVHKKTGKVTDKQENDSMISFAVSSKEGGGLRPKYEPVLDEKGRPLEIDGLPVLRELPPAGYEKDISKIFQSIFDKRIDRAALAKVLPNTWSFTGLLELMNTILPQEEKESVLDSFVDKLFARGAQGLYKGDSQRDLVEKNVALNYALKILGVTPPVNLEQMRQEYVKNYRVTTEGPVGLDSPIDEATGDTPAPVKAQFRKGMPHLHDLRPMDFLDLLDEIHDGNGSFKLQNIPLNVKVDGFGGRFGKNAEGKPFMATSRTEPRYEPGFLKYHQQKGTQDPEILGRAQVFDNLFGEMMSAVQLVDSKLGPDFLTNKQVTCEVLFLPFATETPEGKLKFVGIQYDKLPAGIQLALVPFRVVEGDTGEDLPNSNEFIKQLLSVGRAGSVMFIDNSLVQKEGLDVTALVPPLENIEQFKSMLDDKSPGSLQRKRDVAAALEPVKVALEKAIIEDPNIIGKDILGKDYEGIVINSRLGPIKVTSQEQRDVIQTKQDAKKAAWAEQPREGTAKTAVVAIGSFAGHIGHQELFKLTQDKAKEVGGDPYLFIGNAKGKDDPIPIADKVKTWHMLYPQYSKNISAVTHDGGSIIQKIKHELINPLPGKTPRYDNVIIMVGEDRAGLNMPAALMKAVNKFPGYEHVKVSLEVTPRGTGVSFSQLRNDLKTKTPEQAFAAWSNAFNTGKSGASQLPPDWIKHLMDVSRKGMGIQEPVAAPSAAPVVPAPVAERLSNALIRPRLTETARTSAAVKLSKAWDQQQQKSNASRERAAQAKAEFEKEWKTKQEKEKGVAEATGDEKFDTMMGRMQKEPTIPDPQMPPTNVKDLYQWAVKNNKPYHKIFANWANREGYKSVAQALQKAGNLDSESLDYWTPMAWKAWHGDDSVMPKHWSKERVPDELRDYLETVFDAYDNIVFDWPTEYRQIGEQGVAEGEKKGLYYYVNKRKKAGTSRDASSPKAPTAQAWKDAAKTAKKEGVAEGSSESVSLRDMVDVVDKHYPKYYAELSGSDISDRQFEKAIVNAYKKIMQKQGMAEAGSPAQQAAIAIAKKKEAGVEEENQRLDPSCWKGYRKQGTKMKGNTRVNNCVPVSEDVENIMSTLIEKIIVNETVQNNKRRS